MNLLLMGSKVLSLQFCLTGADFGGGSEYFYSQFELHSREQKILQVVLLQVS